MTIQTTPAVPPGLPVIDQPSQTASARQTAVKTNEPLKYDSTNQPL